MPFETVVNEATLIVRGTLTPQRSYLSPDQCEVFTDYVVSVSELIAGQQPARNVPGPNPLVVRQWGGAMSIGGVNVLAEHSQFPRFQAGVEMILMLVPLGDGQRYETVQEFHGAFLVSGGTVQPATNLRVDPVPLDLAPSSFSEEIRRVRTRKP